MYDVLRYSSIPSYPVSHPDPNPSPTLRSDGGRHGSLGGILGVSGRVRCVAVGVRLALQGKDAPQPAEERGTEIQEKGRALAGITESRAA